MTGYESFSATHIGKSHVTAGTVCQDYSGHFDEDKLTVAIVADGHGSSSFVRSDRGSRFAYQAAEKAIKAFAENTDFDKLRTADTRAEAMDLLCRNVLLHWYELVEADCANNPFTEEEVKNVPEKYRQAYLTGMNMQHAYGTTLIAAVITDKCFFAIRNGDGECVILDKDGHFSKPIPWNDNCESSTTTSLCGTNALADFRFCYLDEVPKAVYIGTDGVDDSYSSEEELYSLYRELSLIGIDNGKAAVESALEEFLPKLTARGSMDDVSIAGIINCEELLPLKDELSHQREEIMAAQQEKEKALQIKRLKLKINLLQKELYRECDESRKAELESQISAFFDELLRIDHVSDEPSGSEGTSLSDVSDGVAEPDYGSTIEIAPQKEPEFSPEAAEDTPDEGDHLEYDVESATWQRRK
jgi:serine/threonine protein phosphatase PrpC